VWNVLIRKSYRPLRSFEHQEEDPSISAIKQGKATAEEVVSLYCQSIYSKTGSYAATARVVGLDQRTVKRRVESTQNYARQSDS
jgi:hypothetical protein